MDSFAMLEHVLALLRSREREPHRALKLQLHLDDDSIEVPKDELIDAHPTRQIRLLCKITDAFQDGNRVCNRVEAKDADRSSLGAKDSEEMLNQGGFAGAVLAHQAENAPFWDVQGEIVENGFGTEPPGEISDRDNGLRRRRAGKFHLIIPEWIRL